MKESRAPLGTPPLPPPIVREAIGRLPSRAAECLLSGVVTAASAMLVSTFATVPCEYRFSQRRIALPPCVATSFAFHTGLTFARVVGRGGTAEANSKYRLNSAARIATHELRRDSNYEILRGFNGLLSQKR